jgi:hypothetical protein
MYLGRSKKAKKGKKSFMEVPLRKDAWLKDIQVHWNLNRGNMTLSFKNEWNKKKSHFSMQWHLCQDSYAMAAIPGHLCYGNFVQNRQDKTNSQSYELRSKRAKLKTIPWMYWSKISLGDYLK